jgi:hypothetical protein
MQIPVETAVSDVKRRNDWIPIMFVPQHRACFRNVAFLELRPFSNKSLNSSTSLTLDVCRPT